MEHDAHAEAQPHAVPPPEDATVDDWAREDAEPMAVDSAAAPTEVAADGPPAPPPEAEGSPLRPITDFSFRLCCYTGCSLRSRNHSRRPVPMWCWCSRVGDLCLCGAGALESAICAYVVLAL
jgi:peptide chain release factor subunit 3